MPHNHISNERGGLETLSILANTVFHLYLYLPEYIHLLLANKDIGLTVMSEITDREPTTVDQYLSALLEPVRRGVELLRITIIYRRLTLNLPDDQDFGLKVEHLEDKPRDLSKWLDYSEDEFVDKMYAELTELTLGIRERIQTIHDYTSVASRRIIIPLEGYLKAVDPTNWETKLKQLDSTRLIDEGTVADFTERILREADRVMRQLERRAIEY